MVLSLRPSLFTTLNSISPLRSSITAGFSGKGTMRLTGGAGPSVAEGVEEPDCFMRFGEALGGSVVALRLAAEGWWLACTSRKGTSGDEGVRKEEGRGGGR